ncbi:Testis-expressed sequence 15 protein, partial [Ophiophagus hannah]
CLANQRDYNEIKQRLNENCLDIQCHLESLWKFHKIEMVHNKDLEEEFIAKSSITRVCVCMREGGILRCFTWTGLDTFLLKGEIYSTLLGNNKIDCYLLKLICINSGTCLENIFFIVRTELREEGKQDKELSSFLVVSRDEVPQICQNGLCTGDSKREINIMKELGNPHLGVYLFRYVDIALNYASKHSFPVENIIIFRVLLGKVKKVQPPKSQKKIVLDPTPNFDCHMSRIHPSLKDSLEDQATGSLVYFYEYNEHSKPVDKPRQCLPYAVIHVKSVNQKGGADSFLSSLKCKLKRLPKHTGGVIPLENCTRVTRIGKSQLIYEHFRKPLEMCVSGEVSSFSKSIQNWNDSEDKIHCEKKKHKPATRWDLTQMKANIPCKSGMEARIGIRGEHVGDDKKTSLKINLEDFSDWEVGSSTVTTSRLIKDPRLTRREQNVVNQNEELIMKPPFCNDTSISTCKPSPDNITSSKDKKHNQGEMGSQFQGDAIFSSEIEHSIQFDTKCATNNCTSSKAEHCGNTFRSSCCKKMYASEWPSDEITSENFEQNKLQALKILNLKSKNSNMAESNQKDKQIYSASEKANNSLDNDYTINNIKEKSSKRISNVDSLGYHPSDTCLTDAIIRGLSEKKLLNRNNFEDRICISLFTEGQKNGETSNTGETCFNEIHVNQLEEKVPCGLEGKKYKSATETAFKNATESSSSKKQELDKVLKKPADNMNNYTETSKNSDTLDLESTDLVFNLNLQRSTLIETELTNVEHCKGKVKELKTLPTKNDLTDHKKVNHTVLLTSVPICLGSMGNTEIKLSENTSSNVSSDSFCSQVPEIFGQDLKMKSDNIHSLDTCGEIENVQECKKGLSGWHKPHNHGNISEENVYYYLQSRLDWDNMFGKPGSNVNLSKNPTLKENKGNSLYREKCGTERGTELLNTFPCPDLQITITNIVQSKLETKMEKCTTKSSAPKKCIKWSRGEKKKKYKKEQQNSKQYHKKKELNIQSSPQISSLSKGQLKKTKQPEKHINNILSALDNTEALLYKTKCPSQKIIGAMFHLRKARKSVQSLKTVTKVGRKSPDSVFSKAKSILPNGVLGLDSFETLVCSTDISFSSDCMKNKAIKTVSEKNILDTTEIKSIEPLSAEPIICNKKRFAEKGLFGNMQEKNQENVVTAMEKKHTLYSGTNSCRSKTNGNQFNSSSCLNTFNQTTEQEMYTAENRHCKSLSKSVEHQGNTNRISSCGDLLSPTSFEDNNLCQSSHCCVLQKPEEENIKERELPETMTDSATERLDIIYGTPLKSLNNLDLRQKNLKQINHIILRESTCTQTSSGSADNCDQLHFNSPLTAVYHTMPDKTNKPFTSTEAKQNERYFSSTSSNHCSDFSNHIKLSKVGIGLKSCDFSSKISEILQKADKTSSLNILHEQVSYCKSALPWFITAFEKKQGGSFEHALISRGILGSSNGNTQVSQKLKPCAIEALVELQIIMETMEFIENKKRFLKGEPTFRSLLWYDDSLHSELFGGHSGFQQQSNLYPAFQMRLKYNALNELQIYHKQLMETFENTISENNSYYCLLKLRREIEECESIMKQNSNLSDFFLSVPFTCGANFGDSIEDLENSRKNTMDLINISKSLPGMNLSAEKDNHLWIIIEIIGKKTEFVKTCTNEEFNLKTSLFGLEHIFFDAAKKLAWPERNTSLNNNSKDGKEVLQIYEIAVAKLFDIYERMMEDSGCRNDNRTFGGNTEECKEDSCNDKDVCSQQNADCFIEKSVTLQDTCNVSEILDEAQSADIERLQQLMGKCTVQMEILKKCFQILQEEDVTILITQENILNFMKNGGINPVILKPEAIEIYTELAMIYETIFFLKNSIAKQGDNPRFRSLLWFDLSLLPELFQCQEKMAFLSYRKDTLLETVEASIFELQEEMSFIYDYTETLNCSYALHLLTRELAELSETRKILGTSKSPVSMCVDLEPHAMGLNYGSTVSELDLNYNQFSLLLEKLMLSKKKDVGKMAHIMKVMKTIAHMKFICSEQGKSPLPVVIHQMLKNWRKTCQLKRQLVETRLDHSDQNLQASQILHKRSFNVTLEDKSCPSEGKNDVAASLKTTTKIDEKEVNRNVRNNGKCKSSGGGPQLKTPLESQYRNNRNLRERTPITFSQLKAAYPCELINASPNISELKLNNADAFSIQQNLQDRKNVKEGIKTNQYAKEHDEYFSSYSGVNKCMSISPVKVQRSPEEAINSVEKL